MFKSLCGDKTLKHVRIMTTCWDETTQEQGLEREKEMASDPGLFLDAVQAGAEMVRHDRGYMSAGEIIS